MKFEWQEIARKDSFGWTERAKVPGGWLIRTCAISDYRKITTITTSRTGTLEVSGDAITSNPQVTSLINDSMSLAMTFIADPTHSWEIEVVE